MPRNRGTASSRGRIRSASSSWAIRRQPGSARTARRMPCRATWRDGSRRSGNAERPGARSARTVRRVKTSCARISPTRSTRSYDLVFVSIGANDALKLRSRAAFRRSFRRIIRRLRSVSPKALILVSSLPGFAQFAALPNPLRWALQLHARSLEDVARRFVATEPGVLMSPPAPKYTAGFFASDRFHPSAQGYRDWVDFALVDAKLVRST